MRKNKSSKTKPPTTSSTSSPALRIGSRVRCTDDGVEGRIIWANAISVKIRWDDGEQVTWRRDALADRPIEILAEGGEDQAASPSAPAVSEQADRIELPRTEPEATPATLEPMAVKLASPERELPAAEQPAQAAEPIPAEPALLSEPGIADISHADWPRSRGPGTGNGSGDR
jgi:hypothetical protein